MPKRADLIARISTLSETRRLVMHCITDHGAVLARLTPEYIATLGELELAGAEAEYARIAMEDTYCRGIVAMVDEWRCEDFAVD